MKYIYCLEHFDHIRTLIKQEILRYGLATDKSSKKNSLKVKKSKSKEDNLNATCNAVFGNSLSSLQNVFVESFGYVPRFLVECVGVLDKHLEVEGLFRRTGSVVRQREYKGYVDGGGRIDDSSAPLDICSLIKQFFRELPNPLMTFELYDTLITCYLQMKEDRERCASVLLNLCLILPNLNLSVLMFFMSFLSRLISHSYVNKMDASNLAICLAPNLLYSLDILKSRKMNLNAIMTTPGRQRSSDSAINSTPSIGVETTIQMETEIVRMLIENADKIGEVSDLMYQKAAMFSLSLTSLPSEGSEEMDASCHEKNKNAKKRGSGSLQGLVSNLGLSISRWLGNKSGMQDCSSNDLERSSMMSVNNSSCQGSSYFSEMDGKDDDKETFSLEEMMAKISSVPYAPKIMTARKKLTKRKAENNCFTPKLGFSTMKRKALMKSLPQSNIPGMTPFSNILKQGAGYGDDDDVTPKVARDLDFNSANRSFNVQIANGNLSLKRIASMRKVDNLSPKSKQNVRLKFRGLLRRLSGNREKNEEKKQRLANDLANESTTSRNSSILNCTQKTKQPVLVPRPPLLGNVCLLKNDQFYNILFGDADPLGFNVPRKQPLGSTDDETCRDLKRIKEQRDTDGFFGTYDRLKSSYEEEIDSHRNAISLSETALHKVPKKEGEEASDKEDNCMDMNGSLLRRGRPNTVRNGLISHSLHMRNLENEMSPDMNILETSPISKMLLGFEDERDVDETVLKVLDVAFNEDDLQSIMFGSSVSEESLVTRVSEKENLPHKDDDHPCNSDSCRDERGDDRSALLSEDSGNIQDGCIQQVLQVSVESNVSNDDVSMHSSSNLPESSLDDDAKLKPSESHVERTDKSEVVDVCLERDDPAFNTIPSLDSCITNSHIKRPTFKVTSDVQYLMDNSGACTDRYNVQLEDDCIKQIENRHPGEADIKRRKVKDLESRRSSLSKRDCIVSKKVVKLPVTSSFNVKAFRERNPVNVPERHSNIVLKKVRENSHLPPISPYRLKKTQEPYPSAKHHREGGRTFQRLQSPSRTPPSLRSSPIPSVQPRIREPLIAPKIARYLANAQSSTSTNIRMRSPMKSIKRLQQASSPKTRINDSPKVRRSPMKPPTPRKQPTGNNAIKFDLDI